MRAGGRWTYPLTGMECNRRFNLTLVFTEGICSSQQLRAHLEAWLSVLIGGASLGVLTGGERQRVATPLSRVSLSTGVAPNRLRVRVRVR